MMKSFARFLGVFFALGIAGCSQQPAAPDTASSSEGGEAIGTPAMAASASPEGSPQWAADRLLEISNQSYQRLAGAKSQDLPFESVREEVRLFMTDRFIDEEQLEQYYKGGVDPTRLYLFHYDPGALLARTAIQERTESRIVVKTMWFANDLNSGYYEISTLVKRGGGWLLDEKRREEMPEGGFGLTISEATVYMKNSPEVEPPAKSVRYVGTKNLEGFAGVYGRFYEFDCDGSAYYFSPVDGYVVSESGRVARMQSY